MVVERPGPAGRHRDDRVEHLEREDRLEDDRDREDGRELRQGHVAEDAPVVGTVDAGGLLRLGRDRGEAAHEHEGEVGRPVPDVRRRSAPPSRGSGSRDSRRCA